MESGSVLSAGPDIFPSVLGRKSGEEFSPRSGRQHATHGASRGLADRPLSPSPHPPQRERGTEGGARAIKPWASALGYSMPPLTGLRKTGAHEIEIPNELLTQNTSFPRA